MSSEIIARVAVSAAIFSIDKPYDYSIPEDIRDAVKVGVRVMVSFGRGKNKCEGMVMALEEKEPGRRLKSICAVLDDAPILGDADLRLAVWLRGQCFATLYDVFRAMLPSGLWYKFRDIYIAQSTEKPENSKLADAIWACPKGLTLEKIAKLGIVDFEHELQKLTASEAVVCKAGASRNVGDKTVKIAHLAAEKEEAEEYLRLKKAKAPARAKIIEYLLNNECTSVKELCYFTGASAATVAALEREGLVSISERLSFRRPKIRGLLGGAEITLNPEQEAAYNSLAVKLDEGKPACSLLYGVTGSGKTPIYVKLVQKAIDLGRESIVLVPEIALTPQLVERFYGYFGDKIAILHSALSVGERFDEWKRIRSGEVSVVVGTRSAVFAPLKKIGLIVIDEEQEHTYKSSGSPRYHAREVAKFRAVQSGALMVLGSATPSVESMYYARSGVYSLHTICARYNKQALPKVIICDMREELRAGNAASIGGVLKSELSSNIEKGEQSILFINRRGTARYCMCTGCGYVPECPNCSASLTYHAANERLMCHHCAFSIEKSQKCPECGGEFKYVGVGTQHVEHELAEQFPNTRVIRMDYDTTSAKSSHDELLRRFEREKIPIMIGT
ncbi:MAG: primosomal protein N', partial [Clostridia bacterium]